MSQRNVQGLLVYTGLEMDPGAGATLGDAGGQRIAVGMRGWAMDVHRAGVEIGLSPLRSCASALSAGSDSPRSAPTSQRPGWDFGGS